MTTPPQRLIGTHHHDADAISGLPAEIARHLIPGIDGEDGSPGPPGPPGPAGSGTTGAQGPSGPPGQTGDDGEDGIQGPPGARGADGSPGAAGATGPAGPIGSGIPGEDGEDGQTIPGKDGAPGATGPTGSTGPAGPIGFGMDGDQGEDGLTIPGQPGAPGATGATGIAGPQGPIGYALDGDRGEDSFPIPGQAGAAGAPGATGPAGPIGFGIPGEDGEDRGLTFGPAMFGSPSGLIGMTAVIGSSPLGIRADSNHAIDPAIAPNWTGIHTWIASATLHVVIQPDVTQPVEIQAYGGLIPSYRGLVGGGTAASPTRTILDSRLLNMSGGGYDNAGTPVIHRGTAYWSLRAAEDWTATAWGSYSVMGLTNPGTTTTADRYRWDYAGQQTAGYLSAGATIGTPPANVTAGDLTAVRVHFGTDGSFTTGISLQGVSARALFSGALTFTTDLDAVIAINNTISVNTATGTVSGLAIRPTFTTNIANPTGLDCAPTFTPASGTLTEARGFQAAAVFNPPAGATVTLALGGRAWALTTGGGGAITTLKGFLVKAFLNAGGPTPTNGIVLSLEAAAGATNNYDVEFGTIDLTLPTILYGRIPVLYNGLKKYIPIYS